MNAIQWIQWVILNIEIKLSVGKNSVSENDTQFISLGSYVHA